MATELTASAAALQGQMEAGLRKRLFELGVDRTARNRFTWATDASDFEGVTLALFTRHAKDRVAELVMFVGIRYKPLEALVNQLARGLEGNLPGNRISHGVPLPSLVPKSEFVAGSPVTRFQIGLENERLLDMVSDWLRRYGLPWVSGLSNVNALDGAIQDEVNLVGRHGSPHLATRAPLVAYLRGDRGAAMSRLAWHEEAFAKRSDPQAGFFAPFARRARELIEEAASPSS